MHEHAGYKRFKVTLLAAVLLCFWGLPGIFVWNGMLPLRFLLFTALVGTLIMWLYVRKNMLVWFVTARLRRSATLLLVDCDADACIAMTQELLRLPALCLPAAWPVRAGLAMQLASAYTVGKGDYAAAVAQLEAVLWEAQGETKVMLCEQILFQSSRLGDEARRERYAALSEELAAALPPGTPEREKRDELHARLAHLLLLDETALACCEEEAAKVQTNFERTIAWNNLGKCREKAGDTEGAAAAWRETIRWGGQLFLAREAARRLGQPQPQGLSDEARGNRAKNGLDAYRANVWVPRFLLILALGPLLCLAASLLLGR